MEFFIKNRRVRHEKLAGVRTALGCFRSAIWGQGGGLTTDFTDDTDFFDQQPIPFFSGRGVI
jgi:hypothetical protein